MKDMRFLQNATSQLKCRHEQRVLHVKACFQVRSKDKDMKNQSDYITDEMLEIYSLEWYAIDPNGHIAHLVNAGIGFMPESMRESDSKRIRIMNYFRRRTASSNSLRVEIKPDDISEKDYFSLFDRMSERGIYSYCFPTDALKPQVYSLVTKPSNPINISDVPKEISEHLSKTQLQIILTAAMTIDIYSLL
jgi:hypothetical protein